MCLLTYNVLGRLWRVLSVSRDQWEGHRAAAMSHALQALDKIKNAEIYAREPKLVK
jgi:hypothetical protein